MRLRPRSPRDLIAGMTLRVNILGVEHKSAVLVPAAAVVRDGEATIVVIVDQESKAHRVEIETGIVTGETVEVVKGLTGGERVVVRGQNGLPDGAAVTIE